ncbi:SPX domain-containing protein [Arachis hypogaea]|nr:SPX domain-containing protein [Arachis hypogaea]
MAFLVILAVINRNCQNPSFKKEGPNKILPQQRKTLTRNPLLLKLTRASTTPKNEDLCSAPATAPSTICSSDCSGDDLLSRVILRRDCVLSSEKISSPPTAVLLRQQSPNFIKLYEICCAFPPTIFSYGDLLHQRFSSMRSVAQVFPVASSCILRLFHLYRASLSIWVFDFLPCQKKLEQLDPAPKSEDRPAKRSRLKSPRDTDSAALEISKEELDFRNLLEKDLEKFNKFLVEKEEEYIIRLKELQDRVAKVNVSSEELMKIRKEIGALHVSLVEAVRPYTILRTSPYCKRIFSRSLLKKNYEDILDDGLGGMHLYSFVAALVPKGELDGEIGDAHMAMQARLMSQALQKLSHSLSVSQCMLIFINQGHDFCGQKKRRKRHQTPCN